MVAVLKGASGSERRPSSVMVFNFETGFQPKVGMVLPAQLTYLLSGPGEILKIRGVRFNMVLGFHVFK